MKFTCKTSDLKWVCGIAARAVGESSLPELEGLQLRCSCSVSGVMGKLEVTGYDMQTAVEVDIAVAVEQPGEWVIGAWQLCAALEKSRSAW